MLRLICLIGLTVCLSACYSGSGGVNPLIEQIIEDIVIEGKSKFRIRKDLAKQSSARIGLVNVLIRKDSSMLSGLLGLSNYDFSISSFNIEALNARFKEVEIIEVSADDFEEKGFDYYTASFMMQNRLNAILVCSDRYRIEDAADDGTSFINACFFWNKNVRLIQYEVLSENGGYRLGESRFLN
ncbi:MAG: hypothetical protein ACE362_13440 [Phaeodactylibacter xiamenensis]|uniref:Uncharacterized protein n=1 Tax=Phaeodactylibacter xiamenensis TaxID=1524460 RepID=A0A098S6X5_9BACT|nr:hypothetical protein [Phaeodactylibacter xiamenensis]KGE87845.1 hypothetical protein IX84_11985 [Phaeodactylibacter xiamenensis]MCR9051906.1 hypothetical protein [bacterium]